MRAKAGISNFSQFIKAAAGVCAVSGAILTLFGWELGRPRLTDWNNTGISMFPNAAICALLSGMTLFVLEKKDGARWQTFARILASVVAVIGGLTFVEHIFGVNLGLDTFLSNARWGQRAATAPMRMGPPASSSFMILGIALFLATYSSRRRQLASALAMLPIGIASMSLVGYWFGADRLFGIARLTGIALETSTIIALLGIGLTAAMPDVGFMAMLARQDAGGVLARTLLLPTIAFPLVFGRLRVLGQNAGLFDTAFGTAAMALTTITMLVLLLSWTANSISRQAEIAARAEQSVRDQREWLRVTLSSIGDAVIATDTAGFVTFL